MRRAPVGQLQPAPVRTAGRGLPGSQASTQVPEYLRRCTRECPSSSRGRPGPCPRWPRRRRRARRRCARPPARRTTCRSRSRPRPAPAGRVQEHGGAAGAGGAAGVGAGGAAGAGVSALEGASASAAASAVAGSGAGSGAGLGLGRCGRGLGALRCDLGELRADVDRLALVDEDLVTTPVPGLGTSVSTLSVEISSSGWSASIVLALGLQPLGRPSPRRPRRPSGA